MSSSSTSSTDREPGSPTSSTAGSMPPSADPVRRDRRRRPRRPGGDRRRAGAPRRDRAQAAGVEIVDGDDADLAVVLGGDGTTLRALHRFLGTAVPGDRRQLRPRRLPVRDGAGRDGGGARRARSPASGRSSSCRRSTSTSTGRRAVAVNDVVCATSAIGRMVELAWSVGGEDLGVLPCDAVICATPTGSTAYNLSSGGPVLVWGLDAMAVTFVSPHSLHARPLVVPRGLDLVVRNETRPDGRREGDRRRDADRRAPVGTAGDRPARGASAPCSRSCRR